MTTKFLELLDRLETLEKAATKGPFAVDMAAAKFGVARIAATETNYEFCTMGGSTSGGTRRHIDSALITALRNAAPGLIAVARAALEVERTRPGHDQSSHPSSHALVALSDAIAKVEVTP